MVLIPRPMQAQVNAGDEVPSVTRTFALTNAHVVQAPDRTMERATVIVRDGLIAAIGPNIDIPFDAEVIPADSLMIYAGFIDGLSHTGIPEPRERPLGNGLMIQATHRMMRQVFSQTKRSMDYWIQKISD